MESAQGQAMEVEDEFRLILEHGVSAIQGRRPYMEDRHTVLEDLFNAPSTGKTEEEENTPQSETKTTPSATKSSGRDRHSFFAVFDGHGGQLASTFAGLNVHVHLAEAIKRNETPQYSQALIEACDKTDRLYAEAHKSASSQDGSTACMVLIAGHKIFTANVGDSRAVMCRNGEALPLSFDHKPDKKEERQRIEDAGGIVKKGSFFNIPMGPFRVYQGDGVRGGLAVSRALGDTFYKDPTKPKEQWLVSGTPEIIEQTLQPGSDEFIIVASDGFWDVFTNEGAIAKARIMLKEKGMSVAQTAQALTELAFMRESLDNITVVVVGIRFQDRDGVEVACKVPAATSTTATSLPSADAASEAEKKPTSDVEGEVVRKELPPVAAQEETEEEHKDKPEEKDDALL